MANVTFKVTASTDAPFTENAPALGVTYHQPRATTIWSIGGFARVADKAEAERAAALFPKYLKVRGGTISGDPQNGTGYVSFDVRFVADGVNKGANETGLKRLRAFLKVASWNYDSAAFSNSATQDQFDRFVAAGSL